MVDKTLILKELKELKGFSKDIEFAKYLGISSANISAWFKRNTFDYNIIVDKFPEVNKNWLLTGEGEMLKNAAISNADDQYLGSYVPLLPISAQGGSLNDFVVAVSMSDCEKIISPIKDVDFAITVAGESMAPDYPSGSQILIKRINTKAFIEWGKVYVLDTCNGTIVKEIRKGDDESYIVCHSINPNPKFEPFNVAMGDIYGMYRVMLSMSIR